MTNQLSVENLSVITHSNIPVVTSDLLAQLYGTETARIRQNHKRNSDRFVEGKHFFNLKDTDLQDFKNRVSKRYSVDNNRPDLNGVVGKRARSLILWTERGAARHAKMLETDQAWDVFEKLEECYFNPQEKAVQPLPQKPVHPCELEFYIPETPLIFNHIQTSQLNALFKSVEYLTMDFWPHMQALFPTLDCKHGSAVNTVNLLMRLLKDKRAEADELSKQN
ncbi:ORF6N domain-containing protein [Pectobacterium parvum]|uniref:ORF6N domain-containing protein n=1 Tax=Pectobacterium TaxID=122277 RepID=UPI00057CDA2D|nr:MULTISPECIES: ORF6N domain-containing protein [Pectobacterium]KHS99930.1 membrane protein [Pectobacterium parvum]UFK38525.1 ORF6N domain-containing protein [Pectobacterium parvum]GKW43299.1 hypothetical protein PEC301879_31570 [Pectobacterium carotovorum subsp. carotovorum]